jgi:hypothetical protein
MPKPNAPEIAAPLKDTLEDIRHRLTSNPSKAELISMQLKLDVLEKWARVVGSSEADHQHNHMADHDNTAFVEPFVAVQAKEKTGPR